MSALGSGYIDSISVTVNQPGALPLFATGVGVLSLLGWRRKKQSC